MARPRAHFWYI